MKFPYIQDELQLTVLTSKYVTHKSKRMEDTSQSQSKEKLLRTGKAADALGVSCNTLRTWANQALINFQLTPGGQRRFDVYSLKKAQKPADRSTNLSFGTTHLRAQDRTESETGGNLLSGLLGQTKRRPRETNPNNARPIP